VEKYLIPAMTRQGIKEESIIVYQDVKCLGNLKAFMNSLRYLENDDTTWHLQDDIAISKTFKEKTESFTSGVVCGFCSTFDKYKKGGKVNVKDMWYSFPCIHIPNNLSKEFLRWFKENAMGNEAYKHHLKENKHDDVLFMDFLKANYPSMEITHLIPNIVDHIDYLLGGSVVNPARKDKRVTSLFWYDKDVVDAIERSLRYAGT